jgi:hypothetical protein
LKVLIYGHPGIGKSTLALSMPNPVLIDADSGVRRIAPYHRVPTLPVSSYQEVLDVLASKELIPFETIVIDTAGKLLDYINAYVIKQDSKYAKRDGSLAIQGWGARAVVFEAFVSRISKMEKHLVFVAHEKEERDGDTKIIRPDFGGGKAGGELIKGLDLIGYMEAIGKNRTISFTPCEKYYAKNAARIDDMLQIPRLDGSTKNDFMTGIVKQCEAAMTEESEQVKQYNTLMEEMKEHIEAIEDAETITAAIEAIKKIDHIWDSKTKVWLMLQEKASSLGFIYDKTNKIFMPAPPTEEEKQEVA